MTPPLDGRLVLVGYMWHLRFDNKSGEQRKLRGEWKRLKEAGETWEERGRSEKWRYMDAWIIYIYFQNKHAIWGDEATNNGE